MLKLYSSNYTWYHQAIEQFLVLPKRFQDKPKKKCKHAYCSDGTYLISSLRNTSLLLYKLLTMRSMSRLTCQNKYLNILSNALEATDRTHTKDGDTSAWYSNFSAGGELVALDSAAVDSYRFPKNKSLFKFS